MNDKPILLVLRITNHTEFGLRIETKSAIFIMYFLCMSRTCGLYGFYNLKLLVLFF